MPTMTLQVQIKQGKKNRWVDSKRTKGSVARLQKGLAEMVAGSHVAHRLLFNGEPAFTYKWNPGEGVFRGISPIGYKLLKREEGIIAAVNNANTASTPNVTSKPTEKPKTSEPDAGMPSWVTGYKKRFK